MMEERHNFLAEMEKNLSDEAESLKKKISENLACISETEKYLHSIFSKEDEDFKVFSPRSAEKIHREDIDDHTLKKQRLEQENKSLCDRLEKINHYLDGLKGILSENADFVNIQILDVQEKERQRIARDLHDTALQNLAHLVHEIELASKYMDKDILQARLELSAVNKNLKQVIEEIRNTIFDLRPMHFDDLGWKDSVERFLVKLKEGHRSFDFIAELQELESNNKLIPLTVFRILQEAVGNAIKHSGGNKIWIRTSNSGKNYNVEIRDNGKGFLKEEIFEKEDRHFGISMMQERVNLLGGKMEINSVPGEGTDIKIIIPMI